MRARGTFGVSFEPALLTVLVAFLTGGCGPRAEPVQIATRADALTAVLDATFARTAVGEASAGQFFGTAVSIDGDTAVVGARGDAVGPNGGQGSAYVFVRSGSTWTQQAKLIASDGAEPDHFGSAVAIRGDTVLVGAPDAEVNNWADAGAAYVFVRSGTSWSEEAKLVAGDFSGIDNFGTSVALDGSTVLVGAPRADAKRNNGEEGGAYVFARAGSAWTQEAKLSASDAANGDRFGWAVALDGSTALVGAPSKDRGSNNQGAAYVFARSAGAWTEQAALVASDGAASDAFGISVSLAPGGSRALVGAPEVDVGGNADQGAAYLYLLDTGGTTWREDSKLVASDGAAGDSFGAAVATSGGLSVVSAESHAGAATGAAYVFVAGALAWIEQAKLVIGTSLGGAVSTNGDRIVAGAAYDNSARVFASGPSGWSEEGRLGVVAGGLGGEAFGSLVRLSGNTALVGRSAGTSIAAYAHDGTTWTKQAELTPSVPDDQLGSAALEGDTAVVGSSYGGSAYVFTRNGATWAEQTRFTPSGVSPERWFGRAVSLSGDTALASAEGAGYVFVRTGTTWQQQAKLLPSDGAPGNEFGDSAALSGDTAMIGASSSSPFAPIQQPGSFYVFVRRGAAWTQQAKLRPPGTPDAGTSGGYVSVLAFEGDRALVSSIDGVRVLERSGEAWSERATLSSASEGFAAAALRGDRILLGFPSYGKTQGSASLLERTGSTWSRLVDIGPPEVNTLGFGAAVAFDGARALVGAPSTYGLPPFGDPSEGKAYAYALVEDTPPADAGGDSGAPDSGVPRDGSPLPTDGAITSVGHDAASRPTTDSGRRTDSTAGNQIFAGGGCGCNVAAPADPPWHRAALGLLLAAAVSTARRRDKRTMSPTNCSRRRPCDSTRTGRRMSFHNLHRLRASRTDSSA